MGKGSKPRPYDKQKYDREYERIFRVDPGRGPDESVQVFAAECPRCKSVYTGPQTPERCPHCYCSLGWGKDVERESPQP